jgi:ABC-type glutathione transport system ATPase component
MLYAQYFLFVDSGSFGTWIRSGFADTNHRPVSAHSVHCSRALVGKSLAKPQTLAGDAPGLDLIIYGAVLVLVIWLHRAIGGLAHARALFMRRAGRATSIGRHGMAEPLLAVDRITCRFGGLLAVNAASLAAAEGCITALIGPNGAGKTTLFSIISGSIKADEGSVYYAGKDVTGEPPHRRARRGIARTFQIVQPFVGLSVRENILVGAHLHHALDGTRDH